METIEISFVADVRAVSCSGADFRGRINGNTQDTEEDEGLKPSFLSLEIRRIPCPAN